MLLGTVAILSVSVSVSVSDSRLISFAICYIERIDGKT